MKQGAVPTGFGIGNRPPGNVGLLPVRGRQRQPRARKNASIWSSRSGWKTSSRPVAAATASRVTSSSVGPKPPVVITTSARARAVSSGGGHPAEVVADGGLVEEIQAQGGQLPGDEGGVRVDDLTQEELRADADDLRAHGSGRHVSTPAAGPWPGAVGGMFATQIWRARRPVREADPTQGQWT